MLSDDDDVIEPPRVHVFIAHQIISWSFFFSFFFTFVDVMPYEKRERQTDRTKKLGTLYSFIISPVRLSIQLFGESYCPLLKFIDPNHLHQLEVHISASNPLLHFTTPVAYFHI